MLTPGRSKKVIDLAIAALETDSFPQNVATIASLSVRYGIAGTYT